MSRNPLRVARALLAAAVLVGAPAGAATISGLSISNSSTNVFDDVGGVGSVAQSTTGTPISGLLGFQVRYAAVIGADSGGVGGATYTQNFSGSYSITFSVTETAGVAWTARVDVLRQGAMTIVDDGNGSATVTLNALNVVKTGAGTLNSSLNLGAVTTLTNSGAPTTSPNSPFSQTASSTITGVGTGSAQSITLTFTFTGSATTTAAGNQGDEAALRMGIDSALSSFTADNYPGVGARSIGNDGIFFSAAVPEPAAEALLAIGLIGLAWFDYTRRPSA